MRKIFLTALMVLVLSGQCFGISDWYQGTGTAPIQGTDNVSDIDTNSKNYAFDPLDKLLTHHIWGCTLTRTSATVVTVSAGEVTCSNGAGTIKRMRQNTSTTTVDMAGAGVGGIDSGSAEKASTWYDLYAVADANATTFTAICAEQGTALSDVTYYRYIGSFYNDAGQDILNFYWFGNGKDVTVMWDVPVAITSTNKTSWFTQTCAAAIPSSSTLGIFGIMVGGDSTDGLWIRPNGGTWNQVVANGMYNNDGASGQSPGQRICMTDSSQQIQYICNDGSDVLAISVEGFILKR